jgi:hypothetical protein
MFGRSGIGMFFGSLIAQIDENKRQQRNKQAGIIEENYLYGVPEKNIECKYDMLDFNGVYYKGRFDGKDEIFDSTGKFLFAAIKYDYLGKGIFLVYEGDMFKDCGALYKDGVKVTEDVFRSRNLSNFEKGNHCVLGYKSSFKDCIINTDCEIVLISETSETSYVYDNVATVDRYYYNLLTKEKICKRSNYSTLDVDEFIFTQPEYKGQVYKINRLTGEFETFGKAPEVKQSEVMKPLPTVEEKVVVPKQQRNDLCNCGSGKKYKNCHMIK